MPYFAFPRGLAQPGIKLPVTPGAKDAVISPTYGSRAKDVLPTNAVLDLDARFGVSLVGQDVSAWEDAAPAAANDFTEAATRPVYSVSSLVWGGQPAITYTAANSDQLVSVDVASTWTFLHDGTGGTVGMVFRWSGAVAGRLFGTANAVGNIGMNLHVDSGMVQYRIRNGSATYDFSGSIRFVPGAPCTVIYTYSSAAEHKLAGYLNGGQDVVDSSAFTPSGAAPTATARIGRSTSGTVPFDGDIVAVHAWNRYFTPQDAALYHQWARAYWL